MQAINVCHVLLNSEATALNSDVTALGLRGRFRHRDERTLWADWWIGSKSAILDLMSSLISKTR